MLRIQKSKGRMNLGNVSIPRTYSTINEKGEITQHDRGEERLADYKNEIRSSHSSIVKQFEEVQGYKPMKLFDEFKEQAETIMEEVNNLKGELYTKEGKKAEIRKRIETVKQQKKQEANEYKKRYEELYADLLDDIDKELAKTDELAPEEVAEISLRNDELQAEIKGRLHNITNTRDLEYEFKTFAKKSKHDKHLARFLSKHYYLFMDRVKDFDTSEMDKQRATHQIKLYADEVKEKLYSKQEQALYVLRERLGNKEFNVIAPQRLIDQYSEKYIQDHI